MAKSKKETSNEETKNLGGRPTVVTPEVISKLEKAFAMGSSVTEACFYADISRQVFYQYLNSHPDFKDRVKRLQSNPVLRARNVIMTALSDGDVGIARWYLERKRRVEFGPNPTVSIQQSVENNDNHTTTVNAHDAYYDELDRMYNPPPPEEEQKADSEEEEYDVYSDENLYEFVEGDSETADRTPLQGTDEEVEWYDDDDEYEE